MLKWILALIIGIVFGGVYYFRFGTQTKVTPSQTTSTIGQSVLLEGLLLRSADTANYSHTLLVGTGLYGLRSKTIVLADYNTGSVTIKGNIVDIIKDIPIVSVDEILKKSIEKESNLELNESFFYSPSLQLAIDFSQTKGYTPKYQGNGKLSIIDDQSTDQEEVMNIQYFDCTTKDPLKDCEKLHEQFFSNEDKKYTNSQSLSFFNLPETDTWLYISADKTFGYYLYPKREEIFNAFINLFFVISPQQIKDKAKEMVAGCGNGNNSLEEILQGTIKYQGNNKAIVVLEGKSSDTSTLVACEIAVKLDRTLDASVEKPRNVISALSKNTTETKKEIQANVSGTVNTGNTNTGNQGISLQPAIKSGNTLIFGSTGTKVAVVQASGSLNTGNIKYLGWLQQQSVRGYNIYYSKKGIRFYGQIIDNSINIGIPGISCSYKVSVMPYSYTGDTADVELYECKGNPSEEELKAKGYSSAGSSGSLSFIVNYPTENLKDLKIKVE